MQLFKQTSDCSCSVNIEIYYFLLFGILYYYLNKISGGASNCSLFSCLCILFNQLFIYEHIDICRLVRIIKPQKQNLFPSYVSLKKTFQKYVFETDVLI